MKAFTIVLGIDPGTQVMGYGAIGFQEEDCCLLDCGVIDLRHHRTQAAKLGQIFESVQRLIQQIKPVEMAIEAPFCGKNAQAAMKLGRAQGVAMAASLFHRVPVVEYAPSKVKKVLTGRGSASKMQVAMMLPTILGVVDVPKPLDASDALAVALCHAFQHADSRCNSATHVS